MKVLIKSRNIEGELIDRTEMHYLVKPENGEIDWFMKWDIELPEELLCPHCIYFDRKADKCDRFNIWLEGEYRSQCDKYAVSISRELGSGYSDRLDPNHSDPNHSDPNLPQPGNYERKKIKGNYYLYWRWWEGKVRHSKYLGKV